MAYSVWCNDAGHLIDDGTVFRLGDTEYRLCTGERQLDWLLDSALGFDVADRRSHRRDRRAGGAGPDFVRVLRNFGLAGVERLKPSSWRTSRARLASMRDHGVAHRLYRRPGLRAVDAPGGGRSDVGRADGSGALRGIRPIGSRALNMARIEAGFVLPNVDFVSGERTLRVGTRALADRARARLAGRLQQGSLHRAARAARGAAPRPAAAAGGARHRGQQAGAQCAAVCRAVGQAPGRQRHVRRPGLRPASAILRWRWSMRRTIKHRQHSVWAEIYLNRELVWERRMATRAGGGAAVLRTRAAARDAAGGLLMPGALHDRNPAQAASLDRPWLDPKRHTADRHRGREQDLRQLYRGR